jgi:hypothetical protein
MVFSTDLIEEWMPLVMEAEMNQKKSSNFYGGWY